MVYRVGKLAAVIAMTIGSVLVTCMAARVGGVPSVTITSMPRFTSSCARAGRRSESPPAGRDTSVEILSFDPSLFAQRLVERLNLNAWRRKRCADGKADSVDLPCLRRLAGAALRGEEGARLQLWRYLAHASGLGGCQAGPGDPQRGEETRLLRLVIEDGGPSDTFSRVSGRSG